MKTLMLLVGCTISLALMLVGAAYAADDSFDTEMSATMESEVDAAEGDMESPSTIDVGHDPAEVKDASAEAKSDDGGDADASAGDDSASAGADSVSVVDAEAIVSPAPARHETILGEVGYDPSGNAGRIHVVVSGDTLWDISDAYLGTPWVWPSVWTDNRDIENPHRINPGDHIWITDSEMRVISQAEADAMRASGPPGMPAAPSESTEFAGGGPLDAAPVFAEQQMRRVSTREWVGLVSPDDLEAAASIVSRVPAQTLMAQMDQVYIGIGEGEVENGAEFDIIRKVEKVRDPESGRFLGYYVKSLGWIKVDEVHAESSLATIRMSAEEIEMGDRLIPRRPESMDIAIQPSPEELEGMIAFFPESLVVIGPLDFVYLNRGTLDGLESGIPLEVVRGGESVDEEVHGTKVEIPRRVVAKLLVVDSQPDTSVALVSHTETDLIVGDNFRGLQE